MHFGRALIAAIAILIFSEATAQIKENEAYVPPNQQTFLVVSSGTYTLYSLQAEPVQLIPFQTGNVSELSVLNYCQVALNGLTYTLQACTGLYDDSVVALRPDMTLVIPSLTVYDDNTYKDIGKYRVTGTLVVQNGRYGFRITSLGTPSPSREFSDVVRINGSTWELSYIMISSVTQADCNQLWIGSMVYAPSSGTLWFTSLALDGQSDFWGGGNTANCPQIPYQRIVG